MNEQPDDPEVDEVIATLDRAETRFSNLKKRVHLLNAAALISLSGNSHAARPQGGITPPPEQESPPLVEDSLNQ